MEAVPKLPLISFELKVSPENTHFGPKLKQYIAEVYREDPDSYSNEIHQLEGLRSAAVRPSIDAAGLSALIRYFCQLRAMQSRFPMAKGQPAACTFTWKDLYANMSCSLADIRFEMASILYNIGALHTQLGTSEPRTTADSLKSACTHYQNAAWAFQYLREQYPQPPGADASTEIMRLLQEICFAQAQECILEKSIQDTRKPTVIGAVATQVLFFYKNSLAFLGPSAGTDNIHEIIGTKLYNYWHRYLSFKSSYIGCIVCLYQGMNAEEQQKMGERVAFYQQAVDKLGETRKLVKYIEPTQVTQEALVFTNDVVEGKRKAAKNENEFIYHEEVPDKDLLMDLKPVCLVKALPINFNDPEVSGLDIFSRLVPMGAHEASSLYSEEKAKLLRRIVDQAEAKTTELTEFMSSLQLDQLDVLDSDQNVPQEIVDRCAAMNAKTEIIQALVDSMNNLAEIISDVEHSLAEIKNLIQEETLKEKEYQKVMGPRPPSIVQTELSREYHKYQEAHTRTNESNQVLHKAMTLHIANLRLLSQPLDVLYTKIPSIDNIEGLDRETMAEMKRVVGKAREMQTQRDSLIQQLREAVTSDDITAVLLARSSEPADEIFKQELEKHTPKVKIIEQNLAAQENIINKLTSLYASYGESRRLLSDVLRKREGLINALVTSYDTYEELLGKCQKGLEFYKKLSYNVGQLLTRLRSTCQVQEEERAQLLAKQTSKASPASTVTPPTPVGPKPGDVTPSPVTESSTPKLKDYLPYMKNRNLARSVTPQSTHVEPIPSDAYYPESIYPTSVRPTPVGSEATDLSQMKLPDGVVIPPTMQNTNPYNRYGTPYAQCDVDPYTLQNYAYPPSKSFDKPEDPNYAYTAYTPSQYSTQMANTQFSNPYYSVTQDTTTVVTDSSSVPYGNVSQANMNSNTNTYNVYTDPYNAHSQMGTIPEAVSSISSYGPPHQADLSANFAKMNISAPKAEQPPFGTQYSQTFYSVQYPQTSTPNIAAYSNAGQDLNTTVSSQVSSDYSYSYPYTSDPANQYVQSGITTNVPISNQHSQPAIDTSGQYVQPIHDTTQYVQHGSTQITSNANQYIQPYQNTSNTQYSQPVIGSDASAAQYIQPGITVETNLNQQPMISNVSNQYTQPNPNASNANQYNYPGTDPNVSSANQYVQPGATAVNATQYAQPLDPNVSNPYSVPSQYSYGTSACDSTPQGYPIYTNADTSMTYSSTSIANAIPTTLSQPYSANTNESDKTISSAALSELDASDKPIKSHVRGEALPSNVTFQPTFQNYDSNAVNYNPTEQTYTPISSYPYTDQSANVSYSTYQNHPGYNYNPATGSYDYNYGSQNSYTNYEQTNIDPQIVGKDPNWSVQGVYTSAGTCETVQSPSEAPQTPPTTEQTSSNQTYYNNPYGYQTTTIQSSENIPSSQHDTNYGAHMNQSTYMQSGQVRDTSVTYSSNQVSTPKEDVTEQPNFESANNVSDQNITPSSEPETQKVLEQKPQLQSVPEVKSTESKVGEPSTFDLLSDIDFTVEQKPLMPEIKVPQISESAIKKPIIIQREEPLIKPAPKEEIIERPAKRDIFSDPSLLNKLTEEVKNLQKLVDSLTNKTSSGLTLLDSKWKTFQDVQTKENMNRSKSIAMKHSRKNIVTEVVPYDDSRVTLQSDPDAYINASYYKQLASWCIPLVISANPSEYEYSIFWKAVLENKISCVVCLLSEIEMQGKFYWPTAKGQSLELSGGLKVTLDEVTCTVHWTERKLTITSGKTTWNVTHYQINVFPAKIVCSPLVLLVDKILSETYDKRVSNQLRGAWVQCARGAGRSALLTLLLMLVCQVRAGQLPLCDMLDAGCVNLYKHRTNVLEDTKYLADTYRAALYYVQGVLCSGTTMFNGEAVSVPSGAAILPPVTPAPPPPASSTNQRPAKFTRESFEEMKQSPGLKSGDMKDPLNFLDPLWSLKKK